MDLSQCVSNRLAQFLSTIGAPHFISMDPHHTSNSILKSVDLHIQTQIIHSTYGMLRFACRMIISHRINTTNFCRMAYVRG